MIAIEGGRPGTSGDWDRRWGDPEYRMQQRWQCYHQAWELIETHLMKAEDKRGSLVDMGCGVGGLFDRMGESSLRPMLAPLAIDSSPVAVEHCRAREYAAAVMDAERPMIDGAVQLISAVNLLEHLEHPDHALRAWRGMVQQDGYLSMVVPRGVGDDEHRLWHWPDGGEVAADLRAAGWRGAIDCLPFEVAGESMFVVGAKP